MAAGTLLTIWLTRMPPPISLPEIMWDKKLFIHGICAISPTRIKRQTNLINKLKLIVRNVFLSKRKRLARTRIKVT